METLSKGQVDDWLQESACATTQLRNVKRAHADGSVCGDMGAAMNWLRVCLCECTAFQDFRRFLRDFHGDAVPQILDYEPLPSGKARCCVDEQYHAGGELVFAKWSTRTTRAWVDAGPVVMCQRWYDLLHAMSVLTYFAMRRRCGVTSMSTTLDVRVAMRHVTVVLPSQCDLTAVAAPSYQFEAAWRTRVKGHAAVVRRQRASIMSSAASKKRRAPSSSSSSMMMPSRSAKRRRSE